MSQENHLGRQQWELQGQQHSDIEGNVQDSEFKTDQVHSGFQISRKVEGVAKEGAGPEGGRGSRLPLEDGAMGLWQRGVGAAPVDKELEA